MLYYNRLDASEGIDINKTNESKKCDTCHYLYFLKKKLKYQPYVCNRCDDLLMMSMKPNHITIFKIENAACCRIISGISKSEAINLVWLKKVEHYRNSLKQISGAIFEAINFLKILA